MLNARQAVAEKKEAKKCHSESVLAGEESTSSILEVDFSSVLPQNDTL